MTRFWRACVFSVLIADSLQAHVVPSGAGTAALVTIGEEKISISFDLSYSASWARAEMAAMDADRDGAVSEEEAEAWMLRTWEEKLAPALELRLDGIRLPIRRVSGREANLVGPVRSAPFDSFHDLEVDLPASARGAGRRTLEIENEALLDESPSPPIFYVPMAAESHAPGLRLRVSEPPRLLDPSTPSGLWTMVGRKLVVEFAFAGQEGTAPEDDEDAAPDAGAQAKPDRPAPLPAASRGPASAEERIFGDSLGRSSEIGFWSGLGLVLLAMLYGAGHALSPGHGKTVVAAYLVGERGRIRDAVVLGLAAAASHTATVFAAGLAIHLSVHAGTAAAPAALQNRIVVATSLISGVLLAALGIGLFLRRWRTPGARPAPAVPAVGGGRADDHGHDHPHGTPRLPTLLGLGFSGGMIPCPAGIVVILLGLQYGKLLFSLFLLVFFSLALGGVLVGIGILLVTGRRILPWTPRPGLVRALPAMSALLIAGLGTFFAVRTFQDGRTEIAAMLEGLARLIRG
jgi:ABC-type nickel/cobalt efflux system permease component RcnA